jgi:hypothetical protein
MKGSFGRVVLNKVDFDYFSLYLRQKKIIIRMHALSKKN